jgi:hypothetical protein
MATFVSLTDEELKAFHELNERVLTAILKEFELDILHANHLVYQPIATLTPCQQTQTHLVIYPHGSSIEYTVKVDQRYKDLALEALLGADGLIIGNHEVRDRIVNLYPDYKDALLKKTQIVGVGVDTSLFKPIDRSQREINWRGCGRFSGRIYQPLIPRSNENSCST